MAVHRSNGLRFVLTKEEVNNSMAEFILKSFWVSTALALILTLPPLGLFITIFQNTAGNLLPASIIGFSLHFVLLAISPKLSSTLISLIDN
jgi:hypothetical protein